ncbi:MAG: PAS domain S-box protein, partial [Promethearchaeota archaeon]
HSMPIVGKKCYEVYHGLDKPCDACPSLRALATKKPALELVPKRGPNQEINGWLDLYAFPLTDEESDKIIGVIEYVRDISDKKKAEKELKDSEEKYKYIFENAQVGLYWSRVSDGKILECNNIFAKILGYDTSNELLGDFFASEHYVNPNDRQKIIEEIKRHGSVSGYEINVTKRDGTPIWLSISARIIEDRIEGAAIDITKRKKAKQELKESERKYKDAFNKINFFKDLLAHDVKNIFNNINMVIQMIGLQKKQKEETTVTPSEEELINMIRIQLEKGIKLISNIQRLSEIEKGEKIKKVIDLKQVINTSLQYIQTRFQERNIEIIRKMPKVIPRVLGGELLIDAFENILLNGIVHNNSKIIRLEIIVSEIHENGLAWVKIEFKDNGIGVEDERKKNIFKRKYTKNNKNGGMGIGLSLVKSIIESYGGRIWVENRIRKDHRQGSNFVMLLKKG